jgi:uncharacterized protein (DUF488 family)
MATPAFQTAAARLIESGAALRTAYLCAEAVPWRCHRQLLSDAVVARGHAVHHILGPGQQKEHVLTPAARIAGGGAITYPALGQVSLLDR